MKTGYFIQRMILASMGLFMLTASHAAAARIDINTPQFQSLLIDNSDGEVWSVDRAVFDTSTGEFWVRVTTCRYWCSSLWEARIQGQLSTDSCRLREFDVWISSGCGCFCWLPVVGFIEQLILSNIENVVSKEVRSEVENMLLEFCILPRQLSGHA